MQTLNPLDTEVQALTFDLADPQMTLMHRAGLAGLYMTLRQLDRENQNFQHNSQIPLQWTLDRRSITLRWEGKALDALKWLFEQSFQLQDGMICLRGLDARQMPPQYLAIAHQGILGTLLQHNSTHKSMGVQTKIYYEDEESYPIIVRYKALTSYVYQEFAGNLCDKGGNLLTKPISIAGWLNPGAAVRHTAFSSDTSFEEPAHLALILLFAPVACCYFVLRSRLREQRAQYALVIPEICDLEKYAKYRMSLRNRTFKEFWASSLGDAGLQFLTMTEKLARDYDLLSCQVVTMGTVAWSTQQKTRTDLYLVKVDDRTGEEIARTYKVSRECLQDKVIARDRDGDSFIATSLARELIADNLARGKPWYAELSSKITSKDLFEKLNYEREGLNQMIQNKKVEWSDPSHRLFVQAFHEALSYTYGQLSSRTQADEQIRFDKVNERFRTRLSRCKTPNAVREFVMDFWARAGRLPTVQSNWETFMQFMMNDWKAARDLALLALVSYKGRDNYDFNVSITEESENQETFPPVLEVPKNSSISPGIKNFEFDDED
ncbi:type I-MYXAN CRISPR-associated Cas8a1/Cmx1 [Pseudanabaena sp. PCC 6802]|uniref:type I-MYXAN CRISPR-associated Cas8a1/Cmx1 n=1 Tax=Pseudanabaena sp. PCC 6802 TaxID=118173 RepID=UPI0003489117|nr:type I-MYXAN CRISPR-associated Cas8a1/Cmx1 [Pseudanabaena sp. PCC 6802]